MRQVIEYVIQYETETIHKQIQIQNLLVQIIQIQQVEIIHIQVAETEQIVVMQHMQKSVE